jgi:PAS domain S-box-containing protein
MSGPRSDPRPLSDSNESVGGDLYRLILNATLDAVVTIDEKGLVLDWNGKSEEIFGWTASEVAGRSLVDFLIPDKYRDHHLKGIAHFLATGQGPILNRRIEVSALRKDGEEIPIELAISPTHRGDHWIFIAFLRDLTAERGIRKRLELQNSILRILAASPPTEPAECDILKAICGLETWCFGAFWRRETGETGEFLRCICTHVNPGIEAGEFQRLSMEVRFRKGDGFPGRIWDKKRAEWIPEFQETGITRSRPAAPDGLPTAFGFPILVNGEVSGIFEFFGRRSMQRDTDIEEAVASIAGQLGMFIERRNAEDAINRAHENLARSERRFRALIENSSDAVAIINTRGTILYSSPSTEKVLGFTDQELIGTNGLDRVHPDDLPGMKRNIERLLSKYGTRVEFEIRIRHKNGSWRWVESASVNLSNDPLIGGILTNYRDTTEKKRANQEKEQAEEQLRQAQKMEAVGRLAGGIAHDFNNLLTSINGYSSMALESLNPEGQLKEFLREILKSGERAAMLTKQLLAYSRKQTLAPKIWDLGEVVKGMEDMLRRVIGEDIDLSVKTCDEPSLTKVDRGQIEQILLNLVLNARDAMPEGGKLMLETCNVDLDDSYVATHLDSEPGSYVMMAVSDTGTGMSESVKGMMFEPFFTTKEAGRGTGLGLSSVYGIVKQSGGSINVYSEQGMGTTFRIYFPRAEAQAARGRETPRAPDPESLRGSEGVLLVEDEDSVRKFSLQALEAQGYRVHTAGNGREALKRLEAAPSAIQLIITDVVMPDMGGHALAERVRSILPGLPIVFISGYTEISMAHRGLIQAGELFLQKPFSPIDLAIKVREALDRKPATLQG